MIHLQIVICQQRRCHNTVTIIPGSCACYPQIILQTLVDTYYSQIIPGIICQSLPMPLSTGHCCCHLLVNMKAVLLQESNTFCRHLKRNVSQHLEIQTFPSSFASSPVMKCAAGPHYVCHSYNMRITSLRLDRHV